MAYSFAKQYLYINDESNEREDVPRCSENLLTLNDEFLKLSHNLEESYKGHLTRRRSIGCNKLGSNFTASGGILV